MSYSTQTAPSDDEGASLILCIATEASGDLLLSKLLPTLRALYPLDYFVGIGGPLSEEAGLHVLFDPRKLAAHGLTEALGVLPATLRALKLMRRILTKGLSLSFLSTTTDSTHIEVKAVLLIDAPELNMRVLKTSSHL